MHRGVVPISSSIEETTLFHTAFQNWDGLGDIGSLSAYLDVEVCAQPIAKSLHPEADGHFLVKPNAREQKNANPNNHEKWGDWYRFGRFHVFEITQQFIFVHFRPQFFEILS